LRSSVRFDDENDFESITKEVTDIHIKINNVPQDDAEEYPRNPFGDRVGSVNSTLYFDDGERSVDYVLVWKKLIPNEDGEDKEREDLKRKEKARVEKREVFEENLVNEGLELERYVVDDEITFIKIHAPLEVLKKFTEILKLRLPMKAVSILYSCSRMIISLINDSCGSRKNIYTDIHIHINMRALEFGEM
jgi:hypothetical protein